MNLFEISENKKTLEIIEWKDFLKKHSACHDGYKEAHTQTPQEWYNTTERSDWMIWVLRKCPQYKDNKNLWVKIAILCAKEVIHLSKDPQQRPQKAIEAAEAYLANPCEETQTLARHAAADAAAAYAYAAAAAAAADAYVDAAYVDAAAAYAAAAADAAAAAYAYAYAAADAAYAAAYAADAAYAAADAAAAYAAAYADAADAARIKARKEMMKKLCEVIRKEIPLINIK